GIGPRALNRRLMGVDPNHARRGKGMRHRKAGSTASASDVEHRATGLYRRGTSEIAATRRAFAYHPAKALGLFLPKMRRA
ncbi:MAG TPA: hypothetical protein VNL35_00365, partial [Chloroflexota bacterium]|nr:hypothetical protein [Chloroflexota bacterium]